MRTHDPKQSLALRQEVEHWSLAEHPTRVAALPSKQNPRADPRGSILPALPPVAQT